MSVSPLGRQVARSRVARRWLSLGVVIVMVAAAVIPLATATALASPGGSPGTPSAAALAAIPSSGHPTAPTTLIPPGVNAGTTSGRGTFFLNSPLPTAPTGNSSCAYLRGIFGNGCLNNTGSPSIVSTPAGVVATAYTTFTNASVCPADHNLTYTEVGVSVSTNGGTSWNAPSYLGNPDCTQAFNYTSANAPTITALGNGTLVLAYIEYNVSNNAPNCAGYIYYPALGPCFVQYDRLVVSLSYNNGGTWTFPAVINSSANPLLNATSWMPAQPSIAAVGDTVYLAWTNFTLPYFDSNIPPSIGLHMVVSTNGAQSWGVPVSLPIQTGAYFGSTSHTAYAPAVMVGSAGTLYVAYATHFQENNTLICIPAGCTFLSPEDTFDIVVAKSTNNATSFSIATVAKNVPVQWNGDTWMAYGPGSFASPEPTIAQDPSSGQLFVAWAGGTIAPICSTSCYPSSQFTTVWVANSTNSGGTWSKPVAAGDSIVQTTGGAKAPEYLYTPSIGVDQNGTVFVDAVYENDSACTTYCDLMSGVVLESTDHGATFPTVFQPYSGSSYSPYPLWDGISTSMTVLNGSPLWAWTQNICPGNGALGYCGSTGGFGLAYSQVFVSSPFEGTGVTVTLNETGLPGGTNWSADFAGNQRSGPAGTNFTVSGVPSGQTQSWSVPWVNATYGHAFGVLLTPPSPGVITGNTVLNATFEPFVLLNIFTVPPAQSGYPFWCGGLSAFFGDYCSNEEVNPTPGHHWLPIHSPIIYNVTDTGLPTFCYRCYNLSFLAWTGSGAGSWNSTSPNGTSTINGPVNETASFTLLSGCSFGTCTNVTSTYSFREIGLPSGTTWTVTLGSQTLSSFGDTITFSAGPGPYPFTVWTVPDGATQSWLGTPSYPSPVTSLQGATETVRFALVADTSLPSEVTFGATGLPAGTSTWGLTVGATSYGVPLTNVSLDLGSGGQVLNASPVYGSNGVGAYATGFEVVPETLNATSFFALPGATVNFTGPALVTARYSPEYWVTLTNSSGGSVSPASVGWTPSGNAVILNATAQIGFSFVGWTGTGPGSVTATTLSITVRPTGPITELASFVLVIPTYQVEVLATGILSGVPLTLTFGTQTYTAPAPFNITGLLAGPYVIHVPTVYPSGTYGVRYDPSSISSSLGLSGGAVHVSMNGTLTLGYTVSYALTVAPTVNGTTSPGPGTYWEVGGTAVPLTATAFARHAFADWIGLGTGSVSGPSASISVTPTGPVTETAYFTTNATIPPATYTFTLTETGLPTGTTWSASIGSNGVSGTGSLVLAGLNGTYAVTVPIVPGTTGVRYVPSSNGTFSDAATQNRSLGVVFTTQYDVNVLASAGGTVTPGSQWVDSGAVLALSATANSTSEFVNWSGTGTGSYSGTSASTSLTVTGPVTEFATFAPHASTTKSGTGSGIGPWLLPIALLVVLLVVGLIVGLVLGRAGGGGRPPAAAEEEAEETEPTADTSNVPQWNEESEPTSSSPPPSGGGEDESVYGGGSG